MEYSILFFIEIVSLLLLSQLLSKMLSSFFIKITHSVKVTIHLLSVIFLPGVMVHELAHWFMASILFVRTGDIEFLPQIQGDVVKLGSVAVAKTDPLRKTFIGVAPIIIGVLLMMLLFYYLAPSIPAFNWQTLVAAYLFFEIGNTMFSSRKDLEGTLFMVVGIVFIIALLYVFKIQVHVYVVNFLSLPTVADFMKKLNGIMFIPLTIDIILCSIGIIFGRRRNHYY
ncbi:MAG TPA: hypothetical protein VF820_00180 [Patescibacteria group bacterium]